MDSLLRLEEIHRHVVWYVPGANIGARGDTNLFTRTFCHEMRDIMGPKFMSVRCMNNPYSSGNVLWALWKGQYPLKWPGRDRRIRNSFRFLGIDSLVRTSHITLISSSFGSVLAAQLALYMVNNRAQLELGPEPVDLVFGSSMLSKESRLFRQLELMQSRNEIGIIIYDELQYPGDNVTAICGKTRFHAITEVFRIAFPITGTYKGQPSIFNRDPVEGHIHRIRESSTDKVLEYITASLIDHELAGPYFKARTLTYITH